MAILDGIKMVVDSGLHPPLTVESDYFNAVKSILKKRGMLSYVTKGKQLIVAIHSSIISGTSDY